MATRIMVIDDELLIGQLLMYQLSGAGYEVLVFQSGAEALQRLAYDPPDLVLLDVMMPEVSGWDLCVQIRSCSAVPVIMLTAKGSDDDVVLGLNCGADDYVGKPFSAPQLIARIEAVLRRSRASGRGHSLSARQSASAQAAASTRARTAAASARPAAPKSAPAPTHAGSPSARPALAPKPAVTPAATAPAATAQTDAPQPQSAAVPSTLTIQPALPRLGPTMAEARRRRRMSLHDAERACGVRWEFLQAIEQEQFGYMPRPQLRAALRAYSDLLAIDLQPYIGRRHRAPRRSLPASLALSAVIALLIVLTLVVIVL